MPDSSIEQSVRRIVGQVLARDIPAGANVGRTTEPAWDSLKHMEILFAIEEELEIQFPAEELAALTDVRDIVSAAERLRAS